MAMKIENMGWLTAGGLCLFAMASGFQGPADKLGVVDLSRVFNESEFAKKQTETLRTVGEARSAMLQFADTYKTFTVEQATRFKDLSVKPNLTEPEKAEIEKIKKDVMAADKQLSDLSQKASPSPAEVTSLNDLNRRKQNTSNLLRRWAQDFDDEVGTMRDKLRADALVKVKESVQQAGKAGAFSLVFANDVAPYGANDVTNDAVKAINKK